MINQDNLRKVVSEWIFYKIPETIDREITIPTDLGIIISIIGPRRAGKTFLMYNTIEKLKSTIPKKNILYINFENENLIGVETKDLDRMISLFSEISNPTDEIPLYLFLDEIQAVPNWSKWINRKYESKGFRLFVSGSSSKLLSTEMSTELRGRAIDFTVLPLSFSEYIRARNFQNDNLKALLFSENRWKMLRELMHYISDGGYPETLNFEAYKEKLLRSYLDTTIIKDVGERFRIEPSILKVFVNYCMQSYSGQISGTRIYNYLRTLNYHVARDFPLRLMGYFSQVFFLYTVQLYSPSYKKSNQYPKKLYLVDTGLIHVLTGKMEIGKNMENIVFLQLYRWKDRESTFEISYWKEYGKSEGMEVDFVISKEDHVEQLINVTYASSFEDINPGEIKSLLKASKELKCKNLKIITWDFFKEGEITYIPLWYWLLNKEI